MIGFRILTANLYNGRADARSFGDVLDALAPDVVAVQELAPNAAREIERRFPYHDLDPRLDIMGLGIATRFPATFGVVSRAHRPIRNASIDVDGNPVEVLTVHLVNPVDWPWWQSARGRGEQIDAIEQHAAQIAGAPIMIVGDMNAAPSWPAYRRLAGSFDDLAKDAAERTGSRPQRTWAYQPRFPRLLRIDHAFGRGLTGLTCDVVTIEGSDHAALVLDMEVTDTR